MRHVVCDRPPAGHDNPPFHPGNALSKNTAMTHAHLPGDTELIRLKRQDIGTLLVEADTPHHELFSTLSGQNSLVSVDRGKTHDQCGDMHSAMMPFLWTSRRALPGKYRWIPSMHVTIGTAKQ